MERSPARTPYRADEPEKLAETLDAFAKRFRIGLPRLFPLKPTSAAVPS